MSTDITTRQTDDAPTITHAGSEMIAATARALVDAHNIGSALCKTAFVPKHFQGKADDAAAAILYGASIDMDPITALQNVFVIGGKPALYARSMVAVVLSKGHKIWTEEETEGSVTVAGQRKGSDTVERVTWTSEMAKRAGYDSNAKYRTDPRSMLYARASGDVARRIAPDALLGMAHNIEELTVDRPADHAPAQPVSVASLTKPTEPTPETGEAPTEQAKRHMFSLFDDRRPDLGERESRLRYVSIKVGRDVESSNDLTAADVSRVIDALQDEPGTLLDAEGGDQA